MDGGHATPGPGDHGTVKREFRDLLDAVHHDLEAPEPMRQRVDPDLVMEPRLPNVAGDVLPELRKVKATLCHDYIGSGGQMREFPDADEPGLARGQGCNKMGRGELFVEPGRDDPDRVTVHLEELAGSFLDQSAAPAGHDASTSLVRRDDLRLRDIGRDLEEDAGTSSPSATAMNRSRGSMYRIFPTAMITARPEGLRVTEPDATGEPPGPGFSAAAAWFRRQTAASPYPRDR